jgi:hypothetical protein
METHGLLGTLTAFGADLRVQVTGLVLIAVICWLAGRRR